MNASRPSQVAMTESSHPTSPAAKMLFAGFLLVLSVWFITRAYGGIVHDARLYLVQALSTMDNARFASDLYFQYGSQDRWSVFSDVYVQLLPALGPARLHFLASILLGAIWILAFFGLVRSSGISLHRSTIVAILTVAVGGAYGAFPVFSFGEPFVSPRILAEALCMAALACQFHARNVLAGALIGIAALVHPLMTIPVVCLISLIALGVRQLVRLVLGAGILILILVSARIEPFGRLLQQFDDQWFSLITTRLQFALPTQWSPISLGALVIPVLGMGHLRSIDDVWRRRVRSLIAAALILMLVAIAGEQTRNVLLVNLQLWRVLWLVAVLGTLGAARWATLLGTANPLFVPATTTIAVAVLERVAGLPPLFSSVSALGVALSIKLIGTERSAIRTSDALFSALPIAALIAAIGMVVLTDGRTNGGAHPGRLLLDLVQIAAAFVLATSNLRFRWYLAGAAILGLISFSRFDRRSPWQDFVESPDLKAELQEFLTGHTQVYWEDGVELLWIKLNRPSYYSCLQGTGLMFFRQTAVEYFRRGAALQALGGRGFEKVVGSSCEVNTNADAPTDEVASVREVCQTLPDLDAIVLPRLPKEDREDRVLDLPVLRFVESAKTSYRPGTVYLFTCSKYRGSN